LEGRAGKGSSRPFKPRYCAWNWPGSACRSSSALAPLDHQTWQSAPSACPLPRPRSGQMSPPSQTDLLAADGVLGTGRTGHALSRVGLALHAVGRAHLTHRAIAAGDGDATDRVRLVPAHPRGALAGLARLDDRLAYAARRVACSWEGRWEGVGSVRQLSAAGGRAQALDVQVVSTQPSSPHTIPTHPRTSSHRGRCRLRPRYRVMRSGVSAYRCGAPHHTATPPPPRACPCRQVNPRSHMGCSRRIRSAACRSCSPACTLSRGCTRPRRTCGRAHSSGRPGTRRSPAFPHSRRPRCRTRRRARSGSAQRGGGEDREKDEHLLARLCR
jgi:hypothetical protein